MNLDLKEMGIIWSNIYFKLMVIETCAAYILVSL